MSLNNDLDFIEDIVRASSEAPGELTVEVNMQCLCADASVLCTGPCPDATAPAVFVEIGVQQLHDGIFLPERTLSSQARVQIR